MVRRRRRKLERRRGRKNKRRCWRRRNKMVMTIYLFHNGRCRLEFIIQGPLFHSRHDLCGHQCARVNRMAVRCAARFVTAVSLRDWGSARVPFRAHRALPVRGVRSAVFYVISEAAAVDELLLPWTWEVTHEVASKSLKPRSGRYDLYTWAKWLVCVGEMTWDVGEMTVGEMTRGRNDRNS